MEWESWNGVDIDPVYRDSCAREILDKLKVSNEPHDINYALTGNMLILGIKNFDIIEIFDLTPNKISSFFKTPDEEWISEEEYDERFPEQ